MALFEVHLTRNEVAHRIVTVEAADAPQAHARALRLARGAAPARAGEEEGEWCDNETGNARVAGMRKLPAPGAA